MTDWLTDRGVGKKGEWGGRILLANRAQVQGFLMSSLLGRLCESCISVCSFLCDGLLLVWAAGIAVQRGSDQHSCGVHTELCCASCCLLNWNHCEGALCTCGMSHSSILHLLLTAASQLPRAFRPVHVQDWIGVWCN